MNAFQRSMIIVAGGLLALFLGLVFVVPWWKGMRKFNDDIARVDAQLTTARATIRTRAAVEKEWREVAGRMGQQGRESETLNGFVIGLNTLAGLVGLQKWSTQPGREQKIGEKAEFMEHAVDTTFTATWESFVRLLLEVHNWEGFLRVQRIAVSSKYEKENHLEVIMRVSTIELTARGGKP